MLTGYLLAKVVEASAVVVLFAGKKVVELVDLLWLW
jgi:hypothetical protein